MAGYDFSAGDCPFHSSYFLPLTWIGIDPSVAPSLLAAPLPSGIVVLTLSSLYFPSSYFYVLCEHRDIFLCRNVSESL